MKPFTVPICPRYGEVDRMGFVYHAHYLVYFEIGRTEYMRARGVSYAEVEDQGHRLVVAEASVSFLQPTHYDEALTLQVDLLRAKGASVVFTYALTGPDGSTRATGRTRLGCLDASGRPVRLPTTLAEVLGPGSSAGCPSSESV